MSSIVTKKVAGVVPFPNSTFINSHRISPRKGLILILFGVLYLLVHQNAVAINHNVLNPVRSLFGLQPSFSYPPSRSDRDVSTMPENPDPWIVEIANLMSEFYDLFFQMGYWTGEVSPVQHPPHPRDNCINTTLTSQYDLESQVVDLLQLLPYVPYDAECTWSQGAGDREFLLYGAFADFRDDSDLEQSRDPFYASVDPLDTSVGYDDEDGQYMRPYYVALNQLGNHGVCMVLNTRTRHLWVIDQESGQADPALRTTNYKESKNRNALEIYASRPATQVLRDFMQKFIDLDWIPGGLMNGSREHANYKRLYLETGWPNHFDVAGFLAARDAWEQAEHARRTAEQPFEQLKTFQSWLEYSNRCDARCHLDQLEVDAASDKWRNSFADPEAWRSVYEATKTRYEEELLEEPAKIARLQEGIAEAEKEIEALPEAIKKARKERLDMWGPYSF